MSDPRKLCRKPFRPVGWICANLYVHDGPCKLRSLDPDPLYDEHGNMRRALNGDSW